MRLHRTKKATAAIEGTIHRDGLLDETNTLSLAKRGGEWHVTVQSNGLRLAHYRKRVQARVYMEYMLAHAMKPLLEIPSGHGIARAYAAYYLRDIHLAAKEEVGNMKPYAIARHTSKAGGYDVHTRGGLWLGDVTKDKKTGGWWYRALLRPLRGGPYETRQKAAEMLWFVYKWPRE